MRNIEEHSIVFAEVEYEDGTGSKSRPVFILRYDDEILYTLRLTSQYYNKSKVMQSFYFEIKDWLQAGLSKPSWIDTVHRYDLPNNGMRIRFVGYLSLRDKQRLFEFIQNRNDLI